MSIRNANGPTFEESPVLYLLAEFLSRFPEGMAPAIEADNYNGQNISHVKIPLLPPKKRGIKRKME